MKEYLIYTTSSNEPVLVNVDYDLLFEFEEALSNGDPRLRIKHTKTNQFTNKERMFDTLYNVGQITSITLIEE